MPADLHTRHSPDATSVRVVWADVAKGACILLVVLHHTTTKHVDLVIPESLSAVSDAWEWITMALKPIRMPLFFVLSGLFAAGAIQRPWGSVARKRIANPYYVFAVWLTISAVIFSVEQDLPMNRTRGWEEYWLDLAFPATGAWFLYALALYFVLAKALRILRPGFVLAVAACLSTMSWVFGIEDANRLSLLLHFSYFIVGAYFPGAVVALATGKPSRSKEPFSARGRWSGLVLSALLAAYIALTAFVNSGLSGLQFTEQIVVASLIGIPLGLKAAHWAASKPVLQVPLSWVGRRTLPIYVLHFPLLALLHHLKDLLPPAAQGGAWAATAWWVVYPVTATLVLTIAALAVHRVLVMAKLGWLFELPGPTRPGGDVSPESVQRAPVVQHNYG